MCNSPNGESRGVFWGVGGSASQLSFRGSPFHGRTTRNLGLDFPEVSLDPPPPSPLAEFILILPEKDEGLGITCYGGF